MVMSTQSEIPWYTQEYPIVNSTPNDGISWAVADGSTIDLRTSKDNFSGK